MASSNDNDSHNNDPFSSLQLLDPSHSISQSSKQAGRIAGRQASFREGQSIGRTKGWEVGLELGYMSSFCEGILNGLETRSCNDDDNNDESDGNNNEQQEAAQHQSLSNRMNSRLDRCATLARDIVTLIKEFPPPQQLLHDNNQEPQHDDDVTNNSQHQRADSTTKTATSLDITTSIQRIRAKFKLLTVLLKTKQSFAIKRILEVDSSNNGVEDDANAMSVEVKNDGIGRIRNDVEQSNDGGDW